MALHGVAWLGWAGQAGARFEHRGMARSGLAMRGGACRGGARQGEEQLGRARCGAVRHGLARSEHRGTARLGVARHGSAGSGEAGWGWARTPAAGASEPQLPERPLQRCCDQILPAAPRQTPLEQPLRVTLPPRLRELHFHPHVPAPVQNNNQIRYPLEVCVRSRRR